MFLSPPQIYTEWANYYLERAKSKRTVGDLSTDCRDGLLLAEVIEAVTTFKVPDLIKKPKTQQQMVSGSNSIRVRAWNRIINDRLSISIMKRVITRYQLLMHRARCTLIEISILGCNQLIKKETFRAPTSHPTQCHVLHITMNFKRRE